MASIVGPSILASDESERMAAVRRYQVLDTPPDGAFDRVTALAARLFDVPIAIVSIVDHDRIWFKSHHGLGIDELPRLPGLCASAILQDGPWIIENAPVDPRALTNPLVAGEFGLKFYAGVPLRTADGHNLGTMCVLDFEPRTLMPPEVETLQDLAATVVDELELRLASRRATTAVAERAQLKTALLGMLSHELRTPVTTIYAATQLLARDPDVMTHPRIGELFGDVAAEADHLLRIIEDLLVMSRLDGDQLVLDPEPIHLRLALESAAATARRSWPHQTLLVECEAGLPLGSGEPVYLEQVVLNLISNAVKYGPAGQPIRIVARAVGDRAEIRVSDGGTGVEPDDRERIFELLFRTKEAVRRARGAGIGLYVCRALVTAMGGQIWADATIEEPSVFVVSLPVWAE